MVAELLDSLSDNDPDSDAESDIQALHSQTDPWIFQAAEDTR